MTLAGAVGAHHPDLHGAGAVALERDVLSVGEPGRHFVVVGSRVSGELLERVYTRSLGNPLFAGELVREMTERCELVLDNGAWQPSLTLSDRVPVRQNRIM